MIGPLKKLFAVQARRRVEDADFAARLDPERTVFLEEMIADVRSRDREALLRVPWLDVPLLTARLAAACVFLEGVARVDHVRGWSGLPLVFFQAGSAEEDAEEHARRCNDTMGFYGERFGHLPPAIQYLHIHTNVFERLEGAWEDRRLRVGKLNALYSSFRKPFVYDGAFRPFAVQGYAIGYRMTDFPGILDVSPTVATDYFARLVVHDLCHGFLPTTPNAAEGFHNAASLCAMGTLPPIAYRTAWERLIHQESVDPAFCLRAQDEIDEAVRGTPVLTPTQQAILSKFRAWYLSARARDRRRRWNLPADLAGAASALRERVDEACADGFRLYVRLMDADRP
ncbi:MAG TPA: hypothetical protein VJ694_00710 [Patescibacteria group bacterium]|nr:hypothetical protein [Patescibacteria group bacterium]